jgi:peptidoglycan hydrolase CwlO-like protein
MQNILSHLLIIITGIISGSLISWLIMRERASVYKESTDRQINRFEKEAVLMKDNVASKEKHINTLTASVSERDADIRNLRKKIEEQNEDLERINERFKSEFRDLVKEVLNEKKNSQDKRLQNP